MLVGSLLFTAYSGGSSMSSTLCWNNFQVSVVPICATEPTGAPVESKVRIQIPVDPVWINASPTFLIINKKTSLRDNFYIRNFIC